MGALAVPVLPIAQPPMFDGTTVPPPLPPGVVPPGPAVYHLHGGPVVHPPPHQQADPLAPNMAVYAEQGNTYVDDQMRINA